MQFQSSQLRETCAILEQDVQPNESSRSQTSSDDAVESAEVLPGCGCWILVGASVRLQRSAKAKQCVTCPPIVRDECENRYRERRRPDPESRSCFPTSDHEATNRPESEHTHNSQSG